MQGYRKIPGGRERCSHRDMERKAIKTTEIVNLFMIEKLVLFFIRPMRAEDVGRPDRHEHFELYYVERGALTMELDGNRILVSAGQCLLTAPDVLHRITESAPETILRLSGFISKGKLLLPLCGMSVALTEDERMLIDEITEEGALCFEQLSANSSEIGYQPRSNVTRGRLQALKNKLEIFLIKWMENRMNHGMPAFRTTVADGVYHYLTVHVADRVTLEQVAEELSLSVSYIKREFSQKYGRGIIDTLLDMKISRAKELIEETGLNFTQIADYLSFESVNHFSKTFKKRTGKTPGEWSKLTQEEQKYE